MNDSLQIGGLKSLYIGKEELTRRDQFAMAALSGMLGHSYFIENCSVLDAAGTAYAYADAMLAASQGESVNTAERERVIELETELRELRAEETRYKAQCDKVERELAEAERIFALEFNPFNQNDLTRARQQWLARRRGAQ